jgi:hypothetical protein
VVARIALAVALVLTLAGCRHEQSLELPPGRAVLTSPTLDPPVHLFADSVDAQLEVLVDRRIIDPDRIRLRARFHPYERVGDIRVTRTDHGELTRLRYEVPIRCLGLPCVGVRLTSSAGPRETGRAERRVFRFQPARLMYEEGGRERILRVVRWPSLESVSRINASQMQLRRFVFIGNVAPLPAITYVLPPALVAALFALVALVLLTPVASLVRRRLRARRVEVVEEEPEVPPLERALQLVVWARDRPDGEDRRRALEVLAVALDDEQRPAEAETARTVAWSPASPSARAADVLVRQIRDNDGRPR